MKNKEIGTRSNRFRRIKLWLRLKGLGRGKSHGGGKVIRSVEERRSEKVILSAWNGRHRC